MLSKSINTASFKRSSATLPSSPALSAHRFLHLYPGSIPLYHTPKRVFLQIELGVLLQVEKGLLDTFTLAECAHLGALCHVQVLFFVNDRRGSLDGHIKLLLPLPNYVSYRIPVRQPALKR